MSNDEPISISSSSESSSDSLGDVIDDSSSSSSDNWDESVQTFRQVSHEPASKRRKRNVPDDPDATTSPPPPPRTRPPARQVPIIDQIPRPKLPIHKFSRTCTIVKESN